MFLKKNIIILIIIIVVFGSWFNINQSFNKSDIAINYLTENEELQNKIEDMGVSVVYGSTYDTNYISYKYQNKEFKKEDQRFWVSINETIDKNILEILWNDKTYEEILEDTGQVSFYKVIDDSLYVIFDGYFISDSGKDKINTIYKISLIDGSYEIITFRSEHSFFSYDICEYDNTIYVSGLYEELNEDSDESIKNIILYEINKEKTNRIDVLKVEDLVKVESFMFINSYFSFSIWNNGYENIYTYDLNSKKIVTKVKNEETELYQEYDNNIILISKQDNNLTMKFNDMYLKENKYLEFDIGKFIDIEETFIYENEMFILIEKEINNHVLYIYDDLNNDIKKIIDFSLVNNPSNLFCYDIYNDVIN